MKPTLLFVSFLFLMSATTLNAQTSPTAQPKYRDMVTQNPNDEIDIKLVSDFINALVSGDADKARNFTTNDYKGYGPGPMILQQLTVPSVAGKKIISGNLTAKSIL